MYGRLLEGHASTTSIQESDASSATVPNTASRGTHSCHASHHAPLKPTISARASAGPGIHPTSIFVLKASPTSNAAATVHQSHRPGSSDRRMHPAAPIRARSKKGSGKLSRFTATEIGVRARTSAAIVAAETPK